MISCSQGFIQGKVKYLTGEVTLNNSKKLVKGDRVRGNSIITTKGIGSVVDIVFFDHYLVRLESGEMKIGNNFLNFYLQLYSGRAYIVIKNKWEWRDFLMKTSYATTRFLSDKMQAYVFVNQEASYFGIIKGEAEVFFDNNTHKKEKIKQGQMIKAVKKEGLKLSSLPNSMSYLIDEVFEHLNFF